MKKIEIDGNEVMLFESMWEYISHFGATVEDYELAPAPRTGEKKVGSFRPVDDVFFCVSPSSEMIEHEGVLYQNVNWGEEELCFIPENDINAEFFMIWEWNEKLSGYDTRGAIYQTTENAENALLDMF